MYITRTHSYLFIHHRFLLFGLELLALFGLWIVVTDALHLFVDLVDDVTIDLGFVFEVALSDVFGRCG